jgi:hypothetical protein
MATSISAELKELIAALSQPFPVVASNDGWRPETWVKWRDIFIRLQSSLESGQPVPDASIARAMDFDGIVGGELLDRAARISNALRAGIE